MLFYFKIFQNSAKASLFPLWWTRKKAIRRNVLSIQNEAIPLVTKCSKAFWLVQENHVTVKPDSSVIKHHSSWNVNLQQKQNWTAKSTNLIENAGKVKSIFVIRATLWAEKLGRCLEYCRIWKNTLEKLAVTVNLEAIWFEFWMKGVLVTVVIFISCGWWSSNQFDVVSETHFSYQYSWPWAVVSYMDWNIHIGKQGCGFILTDFKKWCFDVSFVTSISVSTVILRLGKVEFFK